MGVCSIGSKSPGAPRGGARRALRARAAEPELPPPLQLALRALHGGAAGEVPLPGLYRRGVRKPPKEECMSDRKYIPAIVV